jgi:hypothetical protein
MVICRRPKASSSDETAAGAVIVLCENAIPRPGKRPGGFGTPKQVRTSDKGYSPMRRRVSYVVLATISALTTVGSMSPAPAEAIQDRYCLQSHEWGYPGNCQFSSYDQCMATASGTGASCGINPQYLFARQRSGTYRDRY